MTDSAAIAESPLQRVCTRIPRVQVASASTQLALLIWTFCPMRDEGENPCHLDRRWGATAGRSPIGCRSWIRSTFRNAGI